MLAARTKWFHITCQTKYRTAESSVWQTVGGVGAVGKWDWVKRPVGWDGENKGEKEPKIWGSRCGCAPISPRALETLWWMLWTKGSAEVYPTVSKTAGHLVERASRRKTKKILSQMSILGTYVSSERQMFLCVGSHRVGPHQKHWGMKLKWIYRCSEGGRAGNVCDKGLKVEYRQVQIRVAELLSNPSVSATTSEKGNSLNTHVSPRGWSTQHHYQ